MKDTSGRSSDGKFTRGNDIGAAGKPKGCKNKITRQLETLLEEDGARIVDRVLQLALDGDPVALRLCMERLVSPKKDRTVTLEIPEMIDAKSISEAANAVVQAVAESQITPTEGVRLSSRSTACYAKNA